MSPIKEEQSGGTVDWLFMICKAKLVLHCKFLPDENYGDWELRGPCRENLHYLWKRAVRITKKPYVYCG